MTKHHITDPADPLYLPGDNAVTQSARLSSARYNSADAAPKPVGFTLTHEQAASIPLSDDPLAALCSAMGRRLVESRATGASEIDSLSASLRYEQVYGRSAAMLAQRKHDEIVSARDRKAAIVAKKQSEDVLPEPTGVALLDPLTNKAVMPDGSRATLLAAMRAALLPTDAAELGLDAVRAYAATVRAAGNVSREIEQALYAAELIALPEAEGRRSFALDIAVAYCGKWSADRAGAFLAGLPREDGTSEAIECTPRRSLRDRVLARSKELRAEGRSAADQATGRALAYALDVNDQTGMELAEALRACGINPKAI